MSAGAWHDHDCTQGVFGCWHQGLDFEPVTLAAAAPCGGCGTAVTDAVHVHAGDTDPVISAVIPLCRGSGCMSRYLLGLVRMYPLLRKPRVPRKRKTATTSS
jgi:hypothetical protein